MIMERVPGTPMLDRFKNPLAIPGLLRRMATLHTRLHRLPVEGCPLPYEGPLVDRRTAEIRDLVERFGLGEFGEPLKWLEANRGVVAMEDPVLLHNDFHPLNLMLSDEGEMHVLDWPDAALGDRHHDLARTLALFWLAPPLSRNAVERLLLTAVRGSVSRRYVSYYGEELPLEPGRLRYWEALHAVMAWAQVAAIHGGHGEELGAKSEAAEQVPAGFERSLRAYFWKRAR
jgi:thiamine kinase-like enzyme